MGKKTIPDSRTSSHTFSFSVVPDSRLSGVIVIGDPTPRCPSSFAKNFVLVGAGSVPDRGDFGLSINTTMGSGARFESFCCGGKDGASLLNFSGKLHSLRKNVSGVVGAFSNGTMSLVGGKLGGS